MTFDNLGLQQSLVNILKKENYKKPYPIQKLAIPSI